jgi:uncharacterized membrane protein
MTSIVHRGRDISRLEALSDGVFAFAATLLVVSLDVPDSFQAMVENLKGFGAFAVSFAVLILIWSVHNSYFRRYGLTDGWITLYNSVLLLVVLFYVYPLKFVTAGLLYGLFGIGSANAMINWRELELLFVLYGAGFIAIFLCVALMYRHAWQKRGPLGLTALESHEAAMWGRHFLIMALMGVVSVVMALLGIGLRVGAPGWIYAFIGPAAWIHGSWSDRRKPVEG